MTSPSFCTSGHERVYNINGQLPVTGEVGAGTDVSDLR
jgi:hypothetical protein